MFGFKKREKVVVTKDMTVGEVLELSKKVQPVLMGFGLHCFGCPHSKMETLEEAAMVHGVDIDLMIQKISEVVK